MKQDKSGNGSWYCACLPLLLFLLLSFGTQHKLLPMLDPKKGETHQRRNLFGISLDATGPPGSTNQNCKDVSYIVLQLRGCRSSHGLDTIWALWHIVFFMLSSVISLSPLTQRCYVPTSCDENHIQLDQVWDLPSTHTDSLSLA